MIKTALVMVVAMFALGCSTAQFVAKHEGTSTSFNSAVEVHREANQEASCASATLLGLKANKKDCGLGQTCEDTETCCRTGVGVLCCTKNEKCSDGECLPK